MTFIVPSTILADKSTTGMRELIKERTTALFFIEFPEKTKVFENVTQATVVFSFKKGKSNENFYLSINLQSKVLPPKNKIITNWQEIKTISGNDLTIPLADNIDEYKLLRKVHTGNQLLKDVVEFKQGDINLTFHAKYLSDNKTAYLLVRGVHIQRYHVDLLTKNTDRRWFDFKLMKKELSENRIRIISEDIQKERIVCQQIANMGLKYRLICSLVPKGIIVGNSANIMISLSTKLQTKALIGLINSKLLNWRFKKTSTNNHVNVYELEQLPLAKMIDKSQIDIANLVDKINTISSDQDYFNNPDKQAKVKKLEKEIDQLVYMLYEFTPEEIKIVEEFNEGN